MDFFGEESLRFDEHHHNDLDTIHQLAVLSKHTQELGQTNQDKGNNTHPPNTAQPADDDQGQGVDGV